MKEIVIRKYLVQQVEMRCGLCELHTAPGQSYVPDCLVTWPDGTMELVETKTLGGRLSAGQKRDHVRRARYCVRVRVLWTKEQVDAFVGVWDHWLPVSR